ncbi:MAG: response regulator transcription factor [Lachnospiraceae bacterium]|nr:response regulator transcription factor [Lachnospiraceae bacterium]
MVEDDEMISESICDYLQGREGIYEVECASTGMEGLKLMQENSFDMILLDVMLPGMSGFSLLRELRKTKDIPVIMITAKIREEDRLKGYELGCDDYVCKPFLMSELYAKIGAILRRTGKNTEENAKRVISLGQISVNTHTREVWTKDGQIMLTPREYDLLITLLGHPNWIFTRELLLEQAWGMDYDGTDRTVDNHIKKLRRSLGAAGAQIKTIYGKGYKITDR